MGRLLDLVFSRFRRKDVDETKTGACWRALL